MGISLRHRDFLKEVDFTPAEWCHLLDLAGQLKTARRTGTEIPALTGRNIALVFEKTSTRTRCAFEVAAYEQGARVTYLDGQSSQLGHKESIADTARVLARLYDGIEYRGWGQERVEEFAHHADVPVWNGLTTQWHPTQSLCDLLTMREHAVKPDAEITLAYLGDAGNNVGNSLLVGAAMLGMDVRMVAPAAHQTPPSVLAQARAVAERTGARVMITEDVDAGVADADFVYTDVWVSMGEPKDTWTARVAALRPYQVNATLLQRTGNPDVRFMHCLPALHDRSTTVGEDVYQATGMDGLEVTHDVFESERSIVFAQSENRMHTIKAVLVATLAG